MMDEQEYHNSLPIRIKLDVFHQRQRFSWDCGVSCVLMVLPQVRREQFLHNFHKVCVDEGFNKSTWTIDLCYLLHRYQVHHVYCTVTLGVHPGYQRESFYDKILHLDEQRVNKRFAEAEGSGVKVRKTQVTCEDFVRHLAESGPIILLTNANLLHCDLCKVNRFTSELRSCLPWSVSYHGHYVVLCGYDLKRRKFFFRNPTFRDRVCAMSFSAIDEARKSYGTDEDVIFVFSKSWT